MTTTDPLTPERRVEIAELLRRLIDPKLARAKRAKREADVFDRKAGGIKSIHAAALRAGATTSENEAGELQRGVDDLMWIEEGAKA